MKRWLLAAWLAGAGCAGIAAIRRGDDTLHIARTAARDSQELAAKQQALQRRCAESRDRPVPYEEERALGAASVLALAQRGQELLVDEADAPAGPRAELLRYLDLVGKGVALASQRPWLPWTFVVVVDERPGVFAAGGGFVAITTGALRLVEDEAQLAGLLAHGVARTAEREPVQRWLRRRHTSCVTAGMWADSQRTATQALGAQVHQYQRALGLEADGGTVDEAQLEALLVPVLDAQDEADEPSHQLAADGAAAELLAFSGYDWERYEALLAAWPVQRLEAKPHERAEAVHGRLAELATFAGRGRRPALSPVVAKALATVPHRAP